MKDKIFFWIPRIMAIFIILFFSVFALDVFSEAVSPEVLLALLMHLIPSIIMIAVLIWAWFRGLQGGIAFIVIGLITILAFDTWESLTSLLIITLPLIVTGVLFIIEHNHAVPIPYKKK